MESTAFKKWKNLRKTQPRVFFCHVISGPLVAPQGLQGRRQRLALPGVSRQREAAVSGSWTERATDRRQRWTTGIPPGALALIV